MNFKVDTSGFDKLAEASEKLCNQKKIALTELLPNAFIRQYTDFDSLLKFIEAMGVITNEDFEALTNDALNEHVSETTRFSTWDEMKCEALKEYLAGKLGLV